MFARFFLRKLSVGRPANAAVVRRLRKTRAMRIAFPTRGRVGRLWLVA